MRLIAWDSETHLIKEGRMLAPRPVCLSYADEHGGGLLDRAGGRQWLQVQLRDPEVILVGHNVAFDFGCWVAEYPELVPLVFDAYGEGRISDTKLRQALLDIAHGQFEFRHDAKGTVTKASRSLQALVALWLNEHLEKEDTWRLRYGELDGVPVVEWPEEAKSYAIGDAVYTRRVWEAQDAYAGPHKTFPGMLSNEQEQVRAAWALHLMACWGIRTDGKAIEVLKDVLQAEMDEALPVLRGATLVRSDGTQDMEVVRRRVEQAYSASGRKPRMTPTKKICTDEEQMMDSGDGPLIVLSKFRSTQKLLTTYVAAIEKGISEPICSNPNALVGSGRTSWAEPNLQNPPRAGGVRECFIPREGFLFAGCDYDTLELRSLAEVCLHFVGKSALADAFQRGEDPHLSFAADLLGITLEQARHRYEHDDAEVKDRRQLAKVANFGFPGGMQADSFVEYAKGYGVKVDRALAIHLHKKWMATWHEMHDYFNHVKRHVGPVEGAICQLYSNRWRGGLNFTAAANTYFQGLAADGAKEALWLVCRECYAVPDSPLYGSRPVIFMHDEIIAEVPNPVGRPEVASAAAERLGEVMRDGMSKWVRRVPIKASPVLMTRWYKGAKRVRDSSSGLLLPYSAAT
jgi:hypothetical protein